MYDVLVMTGRDGPQTVCPSVRPSVPDRILVMKSFSVRQRLLIHTLLFQLHTGHQQQQKQQLQHNYCSHENVSIRMYRMVVEHEVEVHDDDDDDSQLGQY